MNIIFNCLFAFLGGAIYEAGCVGWVHYSEKGIAWKTAIFSMLCALAEVVGVGESINTYIAAPFFILGYGFGTYFAVKFKNKNS